MTTPTGGVNLGSAYGEIVISDNIDAALGRATRSFDNALSAIGGRMQSLGNQMSNIGTQLTIVTAPLAAFGVSGIRTAAQYEDAMKEIEVRAGLTAEQLDMVAAKTRDIGLESQYGPSQAADAFLQLLTSGSSVEEAMQQIDAVIQGASASGTELGYTADALTDIMAALGLEASESTRVMQTLTNASGSSSATFEDLVMGFQNIGPMAQLMGLSIEETAATLAVFSENGIKGANAGTQLRSMLNNMTRDTDDVTATWQRLGISMYDTEGQMRDLDAIVDDLNVAMDGMTDEERNAIITTLAGTYGQLGLSALLASGGIDEMEASMAGGADIADVAASKMDTFNGAIAFLRGSIELLQIDALGPLMDQYLRPMIEQVSTLVNRIRDWIIANPELAGQIIRVLAVVTAMGPVLVAAGVAMSALGTLVSGLGAAIGFLLSPIGLVIAAVAALGAAFITDFGGIRTAIMDAVMPALETMGGWLQGLWDFVSPALTSLRDWFLTDVLPQVVSIIRDSVIPIIEDFIGWLGDMWEVASPHLESLANWFLYEALPAVMAFISDTVLPGIQGLIEILGRVWTDVSPFLTDLFDWFMNTGLPIVKGFIENDVMPVVENFIGLLRGIWGAIQPALQTMYDWFINTGLPAIMAFVEGPFTDGINTALGVIQGFLALINGAISATRTLLGLSQAENFNVNPTVQSNFLNRVNSRAIQIPRYATGTNYLPRDMLIQAHKGEAIIPANQNPYNPNATQAAGVGGGGIQITIENITANSRAEGEAAGEGFGERFMMKLRENGWNG